MLLSVLHQHIMVTLVTSKVGSFWMESSRIESMTASLRTATGISIRFLVSVWFKFKFNFHPHRYELHAKWKKRESFKLSGSSVHRKNSTFEHFHFQHPNHGSCVWDQFYLFKNFNVRKKTEGEKFQIETTEAFLAGAASSFSSGIHSPVRQTWDIYAACPPPPWKLPPFWPTFCSPVLDFFCAQVFGPLLVMLG